ncbi:MAG: hypothetical protein ACPGWR_04715 [Ardenticatenaceae bacterium]
MSPINPWLQKVKLLIDKYPLLSAIIGLLLLLAIVILIYPLFFPLTVQVNYGYVTVERPIYVIPSNTYVLTLRANDESTEFYITDSNTLDEFDNLFFTIIDTEDFEPDDSTNRKYVTVKVSSPTSNRMLWHFGYLTIYANDEPSVMFIPVNSWALPLNFFVSILLSAPIVQIFSVLLKNYKLRDLIPLFDRNS